MSIPSWLSQVFRDKRQNPSFTRVVPFACLIAAGAVWYYGTHDAELHGYCTDFASKLLEFSKWAFGLGKASEEVGPAVLRALSGKSADPAPKDQESP